jgi:hypothetical protein
MRRIAFILGILAACAPAFDLLPWQAGQWASYADDLGAVSLTASLVELPERGDALWLQVDLLVPEAGWIVVQIALAEGGAEFIQQDVTQHVLEPEAGTEILSDPLSLLDYYDSFGGEIYFGVDSPDLADRMVLSVTPELLGEFLSILGELGEAIESPEPVELQVEEDVEVEVPAGSFTCRKISSSTGGAWYAEEVPLFGVARVTIPDEYEGEGVFELTDFGLSGAADALEGWPAPLPLETFLEFTMTGQGYEPYTETDALGNKKPRG